MDLVDAIASGIQSGTSLGNSFQNAGRSLNASIQSDRALTQQALENQISFGERRAAAEQRRFDNDLSIREFLENQALNRQRIALQQAVEARLGRQFREVTLPRAQREAEIFEEVTLPGEILGLQTETREEREQAELASLGLGTVGGAEFERRLATERAQRNAFETEVTERELEIEEAERQATQAENNELRSRLGLSPRESISSPTPQFESGFSTDVSEVNPSNPLLPPLSPEDPLSTSASADLSASEVLGLFPLGPEDRGQPVTSEQTTESFIRENEDLLAESDDPELKRLGERSQERTKELERSEEKIQEEQNKKIIADARVQNLQSQIQNQGQGFGQGESPEQERLRRQLEQAQRDSDKAQEAIVQEQLKSGQITPEQVSNALNGEPLPPARGQVSSGGLNFEDLTEGIEGISFSEP